MSMNINARSLDTNAIDQQNGPDQQYDALSDDFGKGASIPQATAIPDDDATMNRAQSVSAREDVTHHGSSPGLPSRILPKERRIQAIAWEKRRGTKLALMFLNADRFKTITDALARSRGDDPLQSITQHATQAPRVGVTIGISMHPDDGDNAETLIRHADIAVYHAENRAGHSYYFFTPGMQGRAIE
jgi:GGDEF domain-containing protein